MESQIAIALNFFLVILMGFSCSSQAHKARTFYVGGKDGWVADPPENYNHWAERNRFQVNDSLIFKYKQRFDSVLEVSKEDYYKCNKGKPMQTLKDGASEFKFHRSGPFYFISGYGNNCEKGQKLVVVVLFPRGGATTKEAPSPSTSPKAIAPPPSHSPSPQAKSPFMAPHQVSHPHLAEAPARSAASVSGGGSIGFLLGFSLMITVVLSSLF